MLDSVSLDGGHIHRTVIAAIEVACWDILGKSLGAPVHQLLGGRVRDSVLGYANGWYRTERTPEAFLEAARGGAGEGLQGVQARSLRHGAGVHQRGGARRSPTTSAGRCATGCRRDTLILIDVHARFTEIAALQRGAAVRRPRHLLVGGADDARPPGDGACGRRSAARSRSRPARCTTRSASSSRSPRAAASTSSSPSRCRSAASPTTLAVADLALAHGSYIAPHQSGGPVATAVCLQLAACVPNFLIQEHFDAFNEPWTRDLVTWHPTIDPANGHLSLPDAPGLGIDLNVEASRAHPYDPQAYLNMFMPRAGRSGWAPGGARRPEDGALRRSRDRRSRSRGW